MKLIKLLKTFSREEIILLRKYLKSPSTKSERNIVELYNYLVKFYPGFDSPKLNREEVYRKLFKGKTFNDRKLDNLYTALTKSAKDFLAHRIHSDDELERLLNLSQGYFNKSLYDESNITNKIIEQKLNSPVYPSRNYVSKLKRLSNLHYSFYTKSYNFENISKGIKNLSEAAVLQFIFDYMNIAVEMKITFDNYGKKAENQFIKNVFDNINIEDWLKMFEGSNFVSKLYLDLHYYKFRTIVEEENDEHYFRLKDLLLVNLPALDRFDRWCFFLHLANYAMKKEDNNFEKFRDESLSIFKSMLESDSYSPSEDQYIDTSIFRSIILCCNNEAEWLHYFIDKYSDRLHPAQRDSLKNYAYAHLHSLKNEFEKSLEYASRIKDEYFFFKTDVDLMLLKDYYELGYIDRAFYALDAFKQFINKNKNIFDDFKVMFVNFLKYFEALLRAKSGDGKIDLLLIKEELEKENNLVSRYWLIKKVNELIEQLNLKGKF
jgi:hypothetical protein